MDSKDNSSLLDILYDINTVDERKDKANDKTNDKVEIEKLYSLPFAREIYEKTLKMENLTIPQMKEAIEVSSYLGVSARDLVDELVWRLGSNKNLFEKYFCKDADQYTISSISCKSFLLEREIRAVFGTPPYYRAKVHVRFYDYPSLSEAVDSNNLRLTKFLAESWGLPIDDMLFRLAAGKGYLDIIKYLHQKCLDMGDKVPWTSNSCMFATMHGELECLKYLCENGCHLPKDMCDFAAHRGHLECLKYLLEKGCKWSVLTCRNAADGGHLEILKYLYENGCPRYPGATLNAAHNGHLECLKYLHENGCPWHPDMMRSAMINRHLDCIKYAHENGSPLDSSIMRWGARIGFLEGIKYACENGCIAESDIYDYIADINTFKYLHEKGVPLGGREICKRANFEEHFECLKYAHEHGVILDPEIYTLDPRYHMNCIKYILSKGCPPHPNACEAVAKRGNLELLKLFHENGFPWDEKTCTSATMHGNLECLQYAHENGCPWDEEVLNVAKGRRQMSCYNYIRRRVRPKK